MDLLILGGTVFLGRHIARAALDRGHRVTLFHRGRHPIEPGFLPPSDGGVPAWTERLGDRRGDMSALVNGRWDAVVDTSGYTPGEIASTLRALAGSIGHYQFVSSVSAYSGFGRPGLTEDAATLPLSDDDRAAGESLDREDPAQRDRFHALYGALKAECERELERSLPGRGLVVRPGLIVGPYDPTDRFSYWPERIALGGEVLAPGRPERPLQFIDARDLAEWMVRLAEAGTTGTFHATGPASTLTMGALLETCVATVCPAARLAWRDDATLVDAGVAPWSELPLWIPESDDSMRGFMRIDVARAAGAGLTFRPLATTIRDTLEWCASRPPGWTRGRGMTPERERQVLDRAVHAARPPGVPSE